MTTSDLIGIAATLVTILALMFLGGWIADLIYAGAAPLGAAIVACAVGVFAGRTIFRAMTST